MARLRSQRALLKGRVFVLVPSILFLLLWAVAVRGTDPLPNAEAEADADADADYEPTESKDHWFNRKAGVFRRIVRAGDHYVSLVDLK